MQLRKIMTFKPFSGILAALLLCAASTAWALPAVEEVEWKEAEVPAPPTFDLKKLVPLEVSPYSSLTYGVDPASLGISRSDSVVRYVVVATSASGTVNAMYEGIHCATGEFKTYARYTPDGHWSWVENSPWRSLFDNMPSKHALRLAKAGACDGAAPVSSVQIWLNQLKNPQSH
jgi:hypothetical protein